MRKIIVFIILLSVFVLGCTKVETGDKRYLSKDVDVCNRMGVYLCEEGETPFTDETGCGCVKIEEEITDLVSCQTDNDCVPLPGCHPRECINKEFESNYEQPEVCTMMFDNEAAYNAEDCICVNEKCENKNLAINKASLTLEEARKIADSSDCVAESELEDTYMYNPSTETWWIDLDLEKEGCNPACVVDEETKTAEINWRCTGLIT